MTSLDTELPLNKTTNQFDKDLQAIMAKAPKQVKEQSQADKFKEAAKELETDNDEKRFDENLKKLAKSERKDD